MSTTLYKNEVFMKNYDKARMLKKHSPKSRILRDSTFAFLFGGMICVLGELILRLYLSFGIERETAGMLLTVTLILLASLVTGLGLFDRIARYAGAGTLVPVTGFSNAVVSEAMDSASEGIVLGVGAKIFTVAGPVILFGVASGVLYGLIYAISRLFVG